MAVFAHMKLLELFVGLGQILKLQWGSKTNLHWIEVRLENHILFFPRSVLPF